MEEKCIYCGEQLSRFNVYIYNKRKSIVDNCDKCTNRLESGQDMYP